MCAALAGGALAQKNNPQPMNPQPAIQAAPAKPPAPATAPNVAPPTPGVPGGFPTARPASPALSDPITRQLNLALGLAGTLRKEAGEGRADSERAGQLLDQLLATLIGTRGESTVKDRSADDEVWSQPRNEAIRLAEEARQLRLEALKQPTLDMRFAGLREAADRIGRMQEKVAEASRKRHETAQNSIRNIK